MTRHPRCLPGVTTGPFSVSFPGPDEFSRLAWTTGWIRGRVSATRASAGGALDRGLASRGRKMDSYATGDNHDNCSNRYRQPSAPLPLSSLLDERFGTDAVSLWNVCCRLPWFFLQNHVRWGTGRVALSVDSTGETAMLPPSRSANVPIERARGVVNAGPIPVPVYGCAPRSGTLAGSRTSVPPGAC
jgi:hypothetical protein